MVTASSSPSLTRGKAPLISRSVDATIDLYLPPASIIRVTSKVCHRLISRFSLDRSEPYGGNDVP